MTVPDTLSVELAHFLTVSGIVFGIGIAVALSKRNAIAVLMGVELMLNGVNLALVASPASVTNSRARAPTRWRATPSSSSC